MYTVKKFPGLFNRCFQISEHKDTIKLSHLPFKDGYYVTDHDIVLRVIKPNIYVLTDKGFKQSQNYFSLWYDGMTEFVNVSDDIENELMLLDFPIIT